MKTICVFWSSSEKGEYASMNISLSWLKRYVDIDVPVQELCDKMVMSGF